MAVYSMTGYGTARSDAEAAVGLGVEIRSVNSRFLDLSCQQNDELRCSDPALRELLGTRLKRGKVEVRAWTEGRHDTLPRVPDAAALQRLLAIQDAVRSWLPTAAPLSVAESLQLTARQTSLPGDTHDDLMALGARALDALIDARAREGDRLKAMLLDRCARLRQLAADAAPLIPALVAQQQQRFLDRWADALAAAGGSVSSDAAQERALSEAAAFAIRIDVAEELTRLGSHLTEIERLLDKGTELGKRLDFLIQELHREANTLGAKSSTLELSRISVDMKVLIEQMREQVQNIE